MGKARQQELNQRQLRTIKKSLAEEHRILEAQAKDRLRRRKEQQKYEGEGEDGRSQGEEEEEKEEEASSLPRRVDWTKGSACLALSLETGGLAEAYKMLHLDSSSSDETMIGQLMEIYNKTAVPYTNDPFFKRRMGAILIIACSRAQSKVDDQFYKLTQWLYLAEANQCLASACIPLPLVEGLTHAKLDYFPGAIKVSSETNPASVPTPNEKQQEEGEVQKVITVACVIEAELERMKEEVRGLNFAVRKEERLRKKAEKDLVEAQKGKDSVEAVLANDQRSAEELKGENERLKEEIERSKNEIERLGASANANSPEKHKAEIAALNRQIAQLHERIDEEERTKQERETKLERDREAQAKETEKLRARIVRLSEEKEKQSQELLELRTAYEQIGSTSNAASSGEPKPKVPSDVQETDSREADPVGEIRHSDDISRSEIKNFVIRTLSSKTVELSRQVKEGNEKLVELLMSVSLREGGT